jgi:hypothetical protein
LTQIRPGGSLPFFGRSEYQHTSVPVGRIPAIRKEDEKIRLSLIF